MSNKDFKVKNKLQVAGITSAGPVVSDASGNLDSTAYIATQYGGTGTSTSPSSGQIPYSASGTTYAPTALNTLDVKGSSYSADAPSSPVVGQIWVESDSSSDSFDPNIIRRQAFTSTAGQTVFTTSVTFIEGYEQVYFNGLLLLRGTDYTTSNSNTVTLTAAAALNDIVEVVTVTNLNSVNTYTQAEIQAGYVSTSGGSTITASSASVKPIVIKGATSQTANLQQWQDSAGNVLTRIQNNGSLSWGYGASVLQNTSGTLTVNPSSASSISVIVKGAASQTANLQEWQSSAGTTYLNVTNAGALISNGGVAIASNPTINAYGAAMLINSGVNTYPMLILKGAASQTANLQEWQDSTGAVKMSINQFGSIVASAGGTYISTFGDALFGARNATTIPLTVKGAASQTANLQEWQNSASTVLAKVDANGSAQFLGLNVQGTGSGIVNIGTAAAVYVGLIIKGVSSQTANLQQWQNSSGTILGALNASGGLELNGKDVEIMNIMGAY